MNHIALILVCCFIMLAGCSKEPSNSLSNEEKETVVNSYQFWRTIAMGIGPNAVRAPFGRYLILKNGESQLCLKLEKHLSSSGEAAKESKYTWVHLVEGSIEDSGTFVISEDGETGSAWIEIAGFKCEWSLSDWVYFDEKLPDMHMAITDFTEVEELKKTKVSGWLSRELLGAMTADDAQIELLKKAIEFESDRDGNG